MNADAAILAELHRLRLRVPEVRGAVLAGTDGMLIVSNLAGVEAEHVAAISAASHSLSGRLARTLGRGPLRESVLRTDGGTICSYPSGEWAVLTVVAEPAAEVALLHSEARRAARRVGGLWASLRRPAAAARPAALTGSTMAPFDPHPPLTTRTPMATLRADHRR